MQLVGNKVDMSHLRAVKSERHSQLAETHGMRSFYVSAKTGDNVSTTFYRVASELAGVTLTKPEVRTGKKALHLFKSLMSA
jgi:Ras-related protein Rab-28